MPLLDCENMSSKRKLVIAVDFDGTLFENAYPGIGKPKQMTINWCKIAKQRGNYLILWTCREGDLLTDALNACLGVGLEFDAVNENLQHRIERFGTDPRKIGADIYLDDRSMLPLENDDFSDLLDNFEIS